MLMVGAGKAGFVRGLLLCRIGCGGAVRARRRVGAGR